MKDGPLKIINNLWRGNIHTLKTIRVVNDYTFQFNFLNRFSSLLGVPLNDKSLAKKFQKDLLKELYKTIMWDRKNIIEGKYPSSVLKDKSLWQKTKGLGKILWDYPRVIQKRKSNQTTLNGLDNFPDYFKRTFHFQPDGYLSEKSAELYDQQVDILFSGTSNIMRRCFFPFVNDYFADKKSLEILEMACGTGVGSDLLKEVFKNSHFTLNDLSPFYLEYAKEKLNSHSFSYIQEEADNLKEIADESFDLTFHIYLFHEIPYKKRRSVLQEQARLTKKSGLIVICDSLQLNDKPEWKEILEDFPKRYHEPFYRNYLEDDLERMCEELNLKILHGEKVLLTKCIIAQKI
ncbi:MAG: class I SAM-dependent methyltransferase [Bacteriovoracaceae bacterium]|nr:class I SAM-dependent methyltransferase [Bacteriovoracaceae bacterium]